jgi:hypothetical protein
MGDRRTKNGSMHNGETGPVTRDERGRWLPGIKQAPEPGRPPASKPGYRDWMALREALPAEKWAKALAKKVEEGDIRAIEYAGNRLHGFPRQQVDGLPVGNAQASAAILQVMVDGRPVEDENAQRAAARAMFEKFRHRPELPSNSGDPNSA